MLTDKEILECHPDLMPLVDTFERYLQRFSGPQIRAAFVLAVARHVQYTIEPRVLYVGIDGVVTL